MSSLSFAQFEREVTGERIRDKITAASKRKGMLDGREYRHWATTSAIAGLVVNRPEATVTVKHIPRAISRTRFRQAPEKRFKTPRDCLQKSGCRKTACDLEAGNSRAELFYELLSNPIYLGEIRHKKERHPGQHQPMSEPRALGEGPTALARSGRHASRTPPTKAPPSPLAGKLFDENGEPPVWCRAR